MSNHFNYIVNIILEKKKKRKKRKKTKKYAKPFAYPYWGIGHFHNDTSSGDIAGDGGE